uniref:Uncharacterized protein n=1 Tax=Oryza rufipogon TaxID=4529 RepID=A0A0E0QGN0_ORYRU
MDQTHSVELVGVLGVQSAAVGRFAVPDDPVHLRPSRCAMSVAKGIALKSSQQGDPLFLPQVRPPANVVRSSLSGELRRQFLIVVEPFHFSSWQSGVWKGVDAVAMPFLAVVAIQALPAHVQPTVSFQQPRRGTCIHSFTPSSTCTCMPKLTAARAATIADTDHRSPRNHHH